MFVAGRRDAETYRHPAMVKFSRHSCILLVVSSRNVSSSRYEAWRSWNNEFSYFMNEMDYSYYYEITQAAYDPSEDNYEDFLNFESTRYTIEMDETGNHI